MRVTQAIYEAANRKPPCGEDGICRSCGEPSTGLRFDAWVKPTFTDHDKLFPGSIVCQACLFCFDDGSQACAAALGKPDPQRMRNYSHFVRRGHWHPLSKGSKRKMAELICDAEVVVIAESGQKHLCFRCPPGWWQFEESTCRPFPGQLQALSQPVAGLYNGGFSKTEIETGRYLQPRIKEFGVAAWNLAEQMLKPFRKTLPLKLALFLAQKDDGDEQD